MGDEMKQTETGMPSLTLEPDFAPEVKKEPEVQVQGQLMEVAPEMDPVQQKMAQTVLTPEEQKMVDDFASKIDVENLTQVMQYGAGTQKKMADFSDEALKNVRAQDLGEVGELLSGVVGELKGFDAEEEKGFFGFFKKQANKLENLKNRYTPEFEIPQNVTFVGTLNMDATTNDLSPKVIDRSCIIKVTKDAGETLCPFEQGVMTWEEMQGEDSFEKQLLKALKKDVSNRVERQRVRMRERLKSGYLKERLSDRDFQDMYLAMKVLPALNVEEVECTLDDGEFSIGDFLIEGGDANWEKTYPLTVTYLKQMCSPEEKTMNYWRMN